MLAEVANFRQIELVAGRILTERTPVAANEQVRDLKPVAFMIMPFGAARRMGVRGAPPEVNCDRLWSKAFCPALEDAGYQAIRADAESGTGIVKDMLERLALADLPHRLECCRYSADRAAFGSDPDRTGAACRTPTS